MNSITKKLQIKIFLKLYISKDPLFEKKSIIINLLKFSFKMNKLLIFEHF